MDKIGEKKRKKTTRKEKAEVQKSTKSNEEWNRTGDDEEKWNERRWWKLVEIVECHG